MDLWWYTTVLRKQFVPGTPRKRIRRFFACEAWCIVSISNDFSCKISRRRTRPLGGRIRTVGRSAQLRLQAGGSETPTMAAQAADMFSRPATNFELRKFQPCELESANIEFSQILCLLLTTQLFSLLTYVFQKPDVFGYINSLAHIFLSLFASPNIFNRLDMNE